MVEQLFEIEKVIGKNKLLSTLEKKARQVLSERKIHLKDLEPIDKKTYAELMVGIFNLCGWSSSENTEFPIKLNQVAARNEQNQLLWFAVVGPKNPNSLIEDCAAAMATKTAIFYLGDLA